MPALDFPRQHLTSLHELGARLLDSRKPATENEPFARELLAGFFDICMHFGLDQVLVDLEEAYKVQITEKSALADHPKLLPALVTKLKAIDLDAGGPRNQKPIQLAECIIAALGLTLSDDVAPTIALSDTVRAAVAAAITAVVTPELSLPKLRDSIIAEARAHCDERYLAAFEKLAAQLDERGMKLMKQPKLPLEAVQSVQGALFDARNAIIGRVAGTALDRVKEVIERESPEAAARIDQPVTKSLTPRDVATLRASDARLPKIPQAVIESLVESVTQLAHLSWKPPEVAVRTYSPREKFAVGDQLDHPKFGRGTVTSVVAQRIDVEFEDGDHTLVHAK